ncbi:hypothetical protein L1887_05440 [Cichorium endivia]|nr:hypothetical protein L1887_05440 [Cichorium endivia]
MVPFGQKSKFYNVAAASGGNFSSPVLNPPDHQKGDSSRPPTSVVTLALMVAQRHSHSNSGSSHIHYRIDSENDSDDKDESLHLHSEKSGSSPLHPQCVGSVDDDGDSGGGDVKKATLVDEKSEERVVADLHYQCTKIYG